MMQFQINYIVFVNFYILVTIFICEFYNVSAKPFNLNYDYPAQDSTTDFIQQSSQPIKPIGGYGHPKLTPRLTQEQIELPNPYLINGNNEFNQINNCEGINCHQEPSISMKNVDQIYNPYNYIQETPTSAIIINKKLYDDDNIFPYNDISVNNMIDRQHQYHQIEQQQQQQSLFKPNIESNLPTSSYQNHFSNLNQQNQNTFNPVPNQEQQQYGIQMENSNYKVVVPHVSNNNVDINFILEQQNEHLRVLLHNIKQQQFKLMQTIMDIQRYVENLPLTTRNSIYWPEKQIEQQQQQQTPINLDKLQQPVVSGPENMITSNSNNNNNSYFNDLSSKATNQQSVGMP